MRHPTNRAGGPSAVKKSRYPQSFLELQVQGPACQLLLPECRVGKGGCFDWGTLSQPRDVCWAQQGYDQVGEQDVRMILLMNLLNLNTGSQFPACGEEIEARNTS